MKFFPNLGWQFFKFEFELQRWARIYLIESNIFRKDYGDWVIIDVRGDSAVSTNYTVPLPTQYLSQIIDSFERIIHSCFFWFIVYLDLNTMHHAFNILYCMIFIFCILILIILVCILTVIRFYSNIHKSLFSIYINKTQKYLSLFYFLRKQITP